VVDVDRILVSCLGVVFFWFSVLVMIGLKVLYLMVLVGWVVKLWDFFFSVCGVWLELIETMMLLLRVC